MNYPIAASPQSRPARRVLLVLLSAALHGLAFPPVSRPLFAFLVVPPFLAALRGLTPGRGAWLGLLWGSAAIWSVGWWVPGALAFYYGQPLWFGGLFALWASLVFAGSFSAGFAACFCWLDRRLDAAARPVLWTATVAALWVAWEFLRANLFTGDPWLLLGDASAAWLALAQIADLGGVTLVSFVVVFTGAALAGTRWWTEACAPRRRAWLLATTLGLLGATLAYGRLQLARLEASAGSAQSQPLRVSVIQGNNDVGAEWREELHGAGLEAYVKATLAAARRFRPELIVWPESAVTFFLAHEPEYREMLARAVRASGAELILGAPHHAGDPSVDETEYFNSAFALDPSGRISARYDKVHLLPFAEYFPLRTIDFLRRHFERVRFFTPGGEPQLLPVLGGRLRAGVAICFEAIFPSIVADRIARGADFLVNLSNDSWLGPAAGRRQHLSMVVMRAIENRVWVVRATTTGVSAVIDPSGRIVAETAVDRAETLDVAFDPRATIRPPPGASRALFPFACLAWVVGVAGWIGRSSGRASIATPGT